MEKMDIRNVFGAEVKRRRAHLGISQEELAERANLHRTYVSDVEAGKRNPSLGSIEGLGATIGALFVSAEAGVTATAGQRPGVHLRPESVLDTLLIEDNPKDVELTLAAFKAACSGAYIRVLRDGEAALDFIFCRGQFATRRIENQPKVVLVRLQLPKVSGLEVLRRIKADARTCKIAVVVLTAS